MSRVTPSLLLNDNRGCFACGEKNLRGLKLKFRMKTPDEIETAYTAEEHHQGFKGILHGGMMALILDEVMVNLVWHRGLNAVSASLNVRLKKAVRTGEKIVFRAVIRAVEKRVVRTAAQALVGGRVVAEAEAVCVRITQTAAKGD